MSRSKNPQIFILLFLAILILSALLRFYQLDLRPVHHDEGINAMWALSIQKGTVDFLKAGGRHGPLPHYFTVFAFRLFGDNDVSLRFFASLFGLGLLIILYAFRGVLGKIGTIASALLLGISSLMVYFTRYAINEIFLVFFTFIMALSLYVWLAMGKKNYFLLAAGAGALMVATKETWVLNLAALLVALTVTCYLHRRELPPLRISSYLNLRIFAGGIFLFSLLTAAFFTTFFSKPREFSSLFNNLVYWLITGINGGGHPYPFSTYLTNIFSWEFPLLFLAGVSTFFWLRIKDRLGTFLVFWAFFTWLAYSIVEYKTPWLTINILLPLGLLAGRSLQYYMDTFLESKKSTLLAVFIFLSCISFSLWKTIELNYYRFDDYKFWVVNVQEPRHIKMLYSQIYRVARAQENPQASEIDLLLGHFEKSPTYWYLRRFPGKILHDDPRAINRATMLLFSDTTQDQVINRINPKDYETGRVSSYPGVVYHLWVKKEAWEQFKKKSQTSKN